MAQLNLFQTQRDNSSENIPLRGQNDASNARKVSGRISLLSGLIRKFSVNHQVLRLFGKQFLRWVPTAFLALAIIGTLKIYENKGNMRSTDKATFNVILFLLAQASIALVNLTYELNDGTDWNGTYLRDGSVKVPNLTCYFQNKVCPNDFRDEITQGQAHSNGNVGSNVGCGAYDSISDILQSRQNPYIFCRRVPGQFAYRFSEYNPTDNQSTFPHFTDRIITTSAGTCFEYDQTGSAPGTDANGFAGATNYTFSNGTYNGSISIPLASGGLKATTYIYRGIKPPAQATIQSCGPRCIWVWAYRSPGTEESPRFYQCPISISTVSNVTDVQQEVPDGVARTAAAAIALQGRWSNGTGNMSWVQMQFYPFGFVPFRPLALPWLGAFFA
ncbi:MAG: hypothetical protein LQ351_001256 [Letrouitia transgressa]|nr:MAG: hypothetical protein LQ351_001256 [Letrouitia transgressa]